MEPKTQREGQGEKCGTGVVTLRGMALFKEEKGKQLLGQYLSPYEGCAR